MCGIIGFVGREPAAPVLLDGLRRLEYRGYDSAGAALLNGSGLDVRKAAGRLARLEELLQSDPPAATTGVGHTRWATHGPPSDGNAHPHLDCTGRLAVVHNGIIENHLALRSELAARGHRFRSDTDTEVVAHLIEENYHGDLVGAVRAALARLAGSWALAVLSVDEPGKLVAARQDSPLVVARAAAGALLASDIPAVLPYTRQVHVLEDGELAVLTADSLVLLDPAGRPVGRPALRIDWDPAAAERGGHEHFMHKEIHEQPAAVRATLAGRSDPAAGRVDLGEAGLDAAGARALARIFVVAMGTARHAGLVGKELIEGLARVPVEVDLASEFRYRDPLVDARCLVVAVSQSGETADTLAAVREARRRGARVLAVTNVAGSSLAREADRVLLTAAGPEVAVASTKAYLTQLVVMVLLAVHLGRLRGTLNPEGAAGLLRALHALPAQLEEILTAEEEAAQAATELVRNEHAYFIGRGLDAAAALEGALKLKEISYIHAEAYPAGELKHGTLALITAGVPVVALATQHRLVGKLLGNVAEVRARGGRVLAVAPQGEADLAKAADRFLPVPRVPDLLGPLVAAVPLQLLAYHAARLLGRDIDKPRNLAKSVTVE